MKKNIHHAIIFSVNPLSEDAAMQLFCVIFSFLGQSFRFIRFNDHFTRKNYFLTQLKSILTGKKSFRMQLQSIFAEKRSFCIWFVYCFAKKKCIHALLKFIFIGVKFHHIRFESIFTPKKSFGIHAEQFLPEAAGMRHVVQTPNLKEFQYLH